MGRRPEAYWKSRDAAERRARTIFGDETWAAIVDARGGQWWASGWRGIPQGYDAEESAAGLLEKALVHLASAERITAKAILRYGSSPRDDVFSAIPGSLPTLHSTVERLAAEVRKTASDTRARVAREREHGEFQSDRFRRAHSWDKVELSPAAFINAVLDRRPDVPKGAAKWAYALSPFASKIRAQAVMTST